MTLPLDADPYTKAGAERLARIVTDYWHARGHKQVKARAFLLGSEGEPYQYGVTSNLVAGKPPVIGLAAFNRKSALSASEAKVPAALGVFKL